MPWFFGAALAAEPEREVAAALTSAHGHSHQEPDGDAPLPADYGTPVVGFTGLRFEGELDLSEVRRGWLSAVGRADLRLELQALGDARDASIGHDLLLGARWRPTWEPTLVPDLTLGLGSVSAVAFRGTAEAPEAFTATRFGISPGIGASFPLAEALALRVDGSVLFAPLPVDGRLGLAGDLWPIGPVRPNVGLELDHRGWRVDSGKVRQTRVALAVGVSAPL